MVIPSDITRWGFVKADNNEFPEIMFEGFYTDYKSGDWRLVLYDEGFSKGSKRASIIKDGFESDYADCAGPKDIYELLKGVGYFVENPNAWQQ